MAKPAWHDDILACYPYLLERLRGIAQINDVLEAHDFAAISGPNRTQVPIDNAVYVLLDGFTPTSDNDNRKAQDVEIGFSIILTKRDYTPSQRHEGVGPTLTAIAKSLQGFDPVDDAGRSLTATPFRQRSPLPIQYEDGFAYFPLRITAQVAVLADNNEY